MLSECGGEVAVAVKALPESHTPTTQQNITADGEGALRVSEGAQISDERWHNKHHRLQTEGGKGNIMVFAPRQQFSSLWGPHHPAGKHPTCGAQGVGWGAIQRQA